MKDNAKSFMLNLIQRTSTTWYKHTTFSFLKTMAKYLNHI